jgi:hypothetical protein
MDHSLIKFGPDATVLKQDYRYFMFKGQRDWQDPLAARELPLLPHQHRGDPKAD